jgi:hypothetical protein
MKFSAAILGILILLTSAYPVPKQLLPTGKSGVKCHFFADRCHKMNCPSKDQKEKKDCNSGACNPFCICNYFPVVPSLFPGSQEAGFIIVSNTFRLFNDNIYPGYYPECWHPPNLS